MPSCGCLGVGGVGADGGDGGVPGEGAGVPGLLMAPTLRSGSAAAGEYGHPGQVIAETTAATMTVLKAKAMTALTVTVLRICGEVTETSVAPKVVITDSPK